MPDDTLRTRRRTPHPEGRSAGRDEAVWETLAGVVAEQVERTGRAVLDVVDVGGGTGGLAVPVARLGHRVRVVDPSPDALAALERRAAEAGVRDLVSAQQGDAGSLAASMGESSTDLVLCHGVLEHVDAPRAAVADLLAVLRPGGIASVLVAQRLGALLARVLAGRFAEAEQLLSSSEGRFGPGDPLPRRFDQASLLDLFSDHPVRVHTLHGVRFFSDLLPGALVDGDSEAAAALHDLERAVAAHTEYPELTAVAAALHAVLERTDT